jgi:trans-AT polyketide synthase/acyltransferase/oxidoreductase domain-containing protein
MIDPSRLGDSEFRSDYGLKYAYTTGSMYKGIASEALVVAMARAGLIGYFGTGGLTLDRIDEAIAAIRSGISDGQSFGMNLLHHPGDRELEDRTVDLFLSRGIRFVESAAYTDVAPSVVSYRLRGVTRRLDGTIHVPRHVLAKVSRPEVARAFMSPAPEAMVRELVAAGRLTAEEGELGRHLPVAGDVCVEADSGGHTDGGVAYALMPAMRRLRDDMMAMHRYAKRIRIGSAGGIGTPEAAAAAFILGADFITTGSINQCTVEAGTSDAVKDMLQDMDVQDTAYAPAGDMFESGSKIQVLRKGVFFPGRANKLYELYTRYNSLDEIDPHTRKQIEDKYFGRSFEEVWSETKSHYARRLAGSEPTPKQKMSLIFRWYFIHTSRLAMRGIEDGRVNYQVHCGPALGAFNQWVKGTPLESWRNRHVADLAERIMTGAASVLSRRFSEITLPDAVPVTTA